MKPPLPPELPKLVDCAESDALQPLACVTVKVWPPTVIVPVLSGPVFAETLNPMFPLPVPLKPDVTVIHPALAEAVHGHVGPTLTEKEPVPEPMPKDAEDEESE